ncbi:MAG: hypothetical protein J5988_06390, partial [Eubacterium sp.]|nr:hypothetical protein [Eubacterium sp.]
MRKFTALIFMCFLTLSLTCKAAASANTADKADSSAAASAVTWSNQETGYYIILEDDADLLTDAQESRLVTEMQEITVYGNAAFKSISYNNYTAASFAE